MKNGLFSFAVALLVSCDPGEKSESAKGSGPRVTRLERSGRDAPNSRDRLRAALDEALEMEDPAARTAKIVEVAREALETAPEVFTDAVVQLPPGSPERTEWIAAGVGAHLKRSPEEALQWAASLADPQAITLARLHVVRDLAGEDPQQAVLLLSQSGGRIEKEDLATTFAIRRWTASAPVDAADWAAALPAGEQRDHALGTAVTQWLHKDPAAAVSWITSQQDPALRGGVMRNVAAELKEQPHFLRDVTLQRLDPAAREELEREIARQE